MKYHLEHLESGTSAFFPEGATEGGTTDLSACPAVITEQGPGGYGVSGSLFEPQQVFPTRQEALAAAEAAILEEGHSLE